MNLYEAMTVWVLRGGVVLRRACWAEARLVPQKDGRLHYQRFANAAMEWDWKPTVADLVARDWEVVAVGLQEVSRG